MSRPSEPLLQWIRTQLEAQGVTVAQVAARLDKPRGEVRRRLTGAEPLTVDDLIVLGELLALDPTQLGMPDVEIPEIPEGPGADVPLAVHAEVLFRAGFEHGIDFAFVADVEELAEWGGPESMLEAYRERGLVVRLDAAVHHHMKPSFDDSGADITLSFDRLYRCRFPWSAILRVTFEPDPPDGDPIDELDEASVASSRPAGSHLRLVT